VTLTVAIAQSERLSTAPVAAVSAGGMSRRSRWPSGPPAAPTGLTAEPVIGQAKIQLAWTDNADNESGYRIERCSGPACSGFAEVATVGPNVSDYSDLSLTSGLLYRYRIRAYNGAGTSAYTGEVEATTNVPGIPTSLTATTMTAEIIRLDWTDNATGEETQYWDEQLEFEADPDTWDLKWYDQGFNYLASASVRKAILGPDKQPVSSPQFLDGSGGVRQSYGHSLVADPWGHVVAR
jgi:hypothetical protein